ERRAGGIDVGAGAQPLARIVVQARDVLLSAVVVTHVVALQRVVAARDRAALREVEVASLLLALDLVAGDAAQDRARGRAPAAVADAVADHAADQGAERRARDAVRVARLAAVLEAAFARVPALFPGAGSHVD